MKWFKGIGACHHPTYKQIQVKPGYYENTCTNCGHVNGGGGAGMPDYSGWGGVGMPESMSTKAKEEWGVAYMTRSGYVIDLKTPLEKIMFEILTELKEINALLKK